MPATPHFAAALSTATDWDGACSEVCRGVLDQLGGAACDLAFAFVTQHHAATFPTLGKELATHLGAANLLACTAESVVGGSREIEGEPALSVWVASLPGVRLWPMELQFARSREGGTFVGWPDGLPEPWPAGSALLLLGEPFSFPADELVRRLNDDQSGVPVIGGLASGAYEPGSNRLWLGDKMLESGAVAVLLQGDVRVRTVVSQGCKPIGRHFVVTKAEQNVIYELGGAPALERLREVFAGLSEPERQQAQRGLHLGRVLSEYQEHFGRGDFLVRNVMGADPNTGAIAIGDYIRVGQTVQFHLRDADSADEDLRDLLTSAKQSTASAAGALLFSCNGRGMRLFGEPNHDAGLLQATLGDVPTAGFFAQGELGPIGGKNFLHGFTASVAIFEGARESSPDPA